MSSDELKKLSEKMTPEQFGETLEFLFKFLQANKDETSGLHANLRQSIEKIDKKLDDYIVRSEPVIKTFENLNWVKKALIYVAAVVAALVTIGAGIPKLFHDILGK